MNTATPSNNHTDLITYLNRKPLQNMVYLKVLRSYSPSIQGYLEGETALLLMPAAVTPWDSETYPNTKWVVMPINGLLDKHIPSEDTLLFKFIDEVSKSEALARYPLIFQRSFTSYTSLDNISYPVHAEVITSETLAPRILECFCRNGHDRDGVTYLFENHQAAAFAIFEGEQPISSCYVFPNTDAIWEIAAVNTLESHRGKGHARKVVQAALHWLLEKGYTPRYHVEDTNFPSIALAKSLGLRQCLHIEHYLNDEL